MFYKKSLTLISATALIAGGFILPASALADSCPANIAGNSLAGIICDFNNGSSVTVESGAQLGGINQDSYNPTNSFIINNGAIDSETFGIHISESTLTNGLTNTGSIDALEDPAILIENQSAIAGGINNSGEISGARAAIIILETYVVDGITNSGTIQSDTNNALLIDSSTVNGSINNSHIIASTQYMALQIDNISVINGDIINSGTISSESDNNPAILLRDNSSVNGDIINSGTIFSAGEGDGILVHQQVTITGSLNNSGLIDGGYRGIGFNYSTITGNIINSGEITGATLDGINLTNLSQVNGSILNSGTITGALNAIGLDNTSTITGSLTNSAGGNISGAQYGISMADESNVAGGINNYGTISGDVGAIFISNDSVATINTFTGSRIIGAINAQNSTINFGGGSIEGTINAGSLNINDSASFNMDYTITVQNAVNNAGEIVIGNTTKTINGAYAQSTGGVLEIGVQNSTTYGRLVVTGTVNLSESGAINLDIANNANLKIGDRLSNVISGDILTAPTSGFEVTDNSRLLNFSASLNGNNGVHLTTMDDSNTSISQSNAATGNKASAGAAAVIDEISQNATGDWVNVANAFNKMSSDQEIASATNQTTPSLQGATNVAIIESMSTTMRIVQARMDSASGMSSGEDFKTARNVWVKPFGSWGNQGNKDGVVGYDSKSYGVIAGVDKDVSENTNLGAGFSYASSTLKSNDANNRVSVDSFLGIGYGDYRLDDKTKINGQFALGYNHSDSRRSINFGGLNRSASGSYHGWNLQAGAGISRVIKISEATNFAPEIRMDYFMVGNRAYEESGAGALNLHVGAQRQGQLIPAFDLKANHNFNRGFSFSLNAGVGYDLLHNENAVTANFADNGATFITRGLEVSPWVVRTGAGITWKQSNDLDLTARYDRRDRGSNYDNQMVSIKARKLFQVIFIWA